MNRNKKPSLRKLSFKKETLRSLTADALASAKGGTLIKGYTEEPPCTGTNGTCGYVLSRTR